jgi:hypothetical protein
MERYSIKEVHEVQSDECYQLRFCAELRALEKPDVHDGIDRARETITENKNFSQSESSLFRIEAAEDMVQ